MNPRKFALLIHIAHQNELEAELAIVFSSRAPGLVGNPYLILGTVELKAWRQGLQRSLSLEYIRERTAEFKRYIKLSVDPGGWKPNR